MSHSSFKPFHAPKPDTCGPALRRALDEAASAKTQAELFEALTLARDLLVSEVVGKGVSGIERYGQLEQALPSALQRLLALTAWPIFDKPALPVKSGEDASYLWVFAVPFVVTLPVERLRQGAFHLAGECFDASALLDLLQESGAVCPDDEVVELRAMSGLYRREDLNFYGPDGIASAFVACELNDEADVPSPLPIEPDPGMDTATTMVLYALCAVRLPRGRVGYLIDRNNDWHCAAKMAGLVQSGLQAAGLQAVRVESLPPVQLAEAVLVSVGPEFAALERNLKAAQQTLGDMVVNVRIPQAGFLEIEAEVKASGETFHLMPPLAHTEPFWLVTGTIKAICAHHFVEYGGTYRLAAPASGFIH